MNKYGLQWSALQDYFAFEETTNYNAWGLGGTGRPPANHVFLYAKDNGSGISTLCYKNDNNAEVCFPVTSGSIPTGSGTANRIAVWSTSAVLAANAALTSTRVMFADSSGLPTDSAALTWTAPNLSIDSATADPGLFILGRNAGTSSPHVRLGDDSVANRFQIAMATGNTFFSAIALKNDGIIRTKTDSANMIFLLEGSSLGSFKWSAGGAGADTLRMVFDATNKRLGIGIASPQAPFEIVDDQGGSNNLVRLTRYGGSATNPNIGMAIFAARNTLGSPVALSADDTIFRITGFGYGNAFLAATDVAIRMKAAELMSSSAHGTYITLETTPTGSTTVAERFRIGPSGQWGIGGATYGTANNIYKSGGASAAPSWGTVNILDSDSHGDTLTGTVVRGDIIIGNSTPKWSRLARGSSGAFIRNDGSDVQWSTLILPNAATANRIAYATSSNTYGESANLAYDGTDFLLGSGTRARMSGQNRFRYLNVLARVHKSAAQTGITANGTGVAVSFNTEDFDTDTVHDNSTNNSRLTCPLTGKYLIEASLFCDNTNATGTLNWSLGFLKVNGTTNYSSHYHIIDGSKLASGVVTLTAILSLSATDYVELYAATSATGGTFDVSTNTYFAMTYLGE